MYLVFSIMKCSAISKESNDALDVAQALYKECYDYAVKTDQVNCETNLGKCNF